MHLLVRQAHDLDAEEAADDLGQTPADLVLLSFSDSDLGAASAAWQAMEPGERPALRLANLARLRHPMSVDLYAEQVIAHARCVIVRLLGGLEYWRYGVEELSSLCRASDIALALLPGDARDDPELQDLGTISADHRGRLSACLAQGGPENLRRAILLAAHLGGIGPDPAQPALPLPDYGEYLLPPCRLPLPLAGEGSLRQSNEPHVAPATLTQPSPASGRGLSSGPRRGWANAVIIFYRSHLQAGDTAPVQALAAALAERGFATRAFYAASLKEPACAAFIAEQLGAWRPHIVLNATAFAARRDDAPSPLEAADAPVLQLVLSGSTRESWANSSRGLSPSDLAMNVVLPELDGRLLTTAISFKVAEQPVLGLEYARTVHHADADGVALAAGRATGWARLATTPKPDRRIAIVLSDYPGASGQIGHAVGLDTFASLSTILDLLRAAGYTTESSATPDLVETLCHSDPSKLLHSADYLRLFATLPEPIQQNIRAAWGDPSEAIALRMRRLGNLVLAVQPGRGAALDHKSRYHDPDQPPCHAYVAFYLWLRHVFDAHAILHLGTHGTLEWLPGKAAALSLACFPALLGAGLPVIYPFIANNPGEAAAAKRRLGAVTIGHLTPPLRPAGTHGAAIALERLIDEYAAADGMDRRRNALLRREILERADSAGLLAESGANDLPDDDRLARLDAYLCDVKEAQIRDGLHTFGEDPDPARRAALLSVLPPAAADALDRCAASERAGLLAALDGRFVPPGPAGAPTRGRADVLPTGRNLFTTDPRLVPTPTAVALAEKSAAELIRRHLQDHGDHPRALVMNLWGSATMRTGGEDLALALLLLGVRPSWDSGSGRVTGFEIIPIALLDRPRVDVTLRISGLFRDGFAAQIDLFDAAIRAVAGLDEAADWNPLAGRAGPRIYGPAPGNYGAGDTLQDGAYLAASAAAYGKAFDGLPDREGFARRAAAADAFVSVQDHRETDILDGTEWAAHEGGFAALATALGRAPALYHLDTGAPEAPRARTLPEEVARIVRARAANPVWIAGMRPHGYRGAAEIARAVDGLHAFAACLPHRFDRQFELLFEATLGDPATAAFLAAANPQARAAMAGRFQDALDRGLWHCRRNDVGAILAGETP